MEDYKRLLNKYKEPDAFMNMTQEELSEYTEAYKCFLSEQKKISEEEKHKTIEKHSIKINYLNDTDPDIFQNPDVYKFRDYITDLTDDSFSSKDQKIVTLKSKQTLFNELLSNIKFSDNRTHAAWFLERESGQKQPLHPKELRYFIELIEHKIEYLKNLPGDHYPNLKLEIDSHRFVLLEELGILESLKQGFPELKHDQTRLARLVQLILYGSTEDKKKLESIRGHLKGMANNSSKTPLTQKAINNVRGELQKISVEIKK